MYNVAVEGAERPGQSRRDFLKGNRNPESFEEIPTGYPVVTGTVKWDFRRGRRPSHPTDFAYYSESEWRKALINN